MDGSASVVRLLVVSGGTATATVQAVKAATLAQLHGLHTARYCGLCASRLQQSERLRPPQHCISCIQNRYSSRITMPTVVEKSLKVSDIERERERASRWDLAAALPSCLQRASRLDVVRSSLPI